MLVFCAYINRDSNKRTNRGVDGTLSVRCYLVRADHRKETKEMNEVKPISLNNKVILAESVLWTDMGGKAIMLDTTHEAYHGLDEVAARMLAVLTESESIQDAYNILLSEYEVSPEVLTDDLLEFIEELRTDGLVEVIVA